MKKKIINFASISFLVMALMSFNTSNAQTTDQSTGVSSDQTKSTEAILANAPCESVPGIVVALDQVNNNYDIQDINSGELYKYSTTETFNLFEPVIVTLQRAKGGKVIVRNVTR